MVGLQVEKGATSVLGGLLVRLGFSPDGDGAVKHVEVFLDRVVVLLQLGLDRSDCACVVAIKQHSTTQLAEDLRRKQRPNRGLDVVQQAPGLSLTLHDRATSGVVDAVRAPSIAAQFVQIGDEGFDHRRELLALPSGCKANLDDKVSEFAEQGRSQVNVFDNRGEIEVRRKIECRGDIQTRRDVQGGRKIHRGRQIDSRQIDGRQEIHCRGVECLQGAKLQGGKNRAQQLRLDEA